MNTMLALIIFHDVSMLDTQYLMPDKIKQILRISFTFKYRNINKNFNIPVNFNQN